MKCLGALTSRNNDKIKSVCSLSEKRFRDEKGCFAVEGIRLFTDAVKSGIRIRDVFVTDEALAKYGDDIGRADIASGGYYLIPASVADKLSDTKSPQGIFCVCEKKSCDKIEVSSSGLYILTDNIQNPDNLGAIVRTAEALGFDGIFVCGGCDIFSPKAMRASMGGLLRFPVEYVPDAVVKISSLRECGLRVCATVPDGSADDITQSGIKNGACLVIGNEGNGISSCVLDACTDRLTIRMRGKAESLNASVAATIAMWELTR